MTTVEIAETSERSPKELFPDTEIPEGFLEIFDDEEIERMQSLTPIEFQRIVACFRLRESKLNLDLSNLDIKEIDKKLKEFIEEMMNNPGSDLMCTFIIKITEWYKKLAPQAGISIK